MAPQGLRPVNSSSAILPGTGYLVPIDEHVFWVGIACSGDEALEGLARSQIYCNHISPVNDNNENDRCLVFFLPGNEPKFACFKWYSIYTLGDKGLEIATDLVATHAPENIDSFLSACEAWRYPLGDDAAGDRGALAHWKSTLGLSTEGRIAVRDGGESGSIIGRNDNTGHETTGDHKFAMSLSKAEAVEEEASKRRESSDRHFAEAVDIEWRLNKTDARTPSMQQDVRSSEDYTKSVFLPHSPTVQVGSLPTPPSSQEASIHFTRDQNRAFGLVYTGLKRKRESESGIGSETKTLRLQAIKKEAKAKTRRAATKKWVQKINPMDTDDAEPESSNSSEDEDGTGESTYLSPHQRRQINHGILDDLRLGGRMDSFGGRDLDADAGGLGDSERDDMLTEDDGVAVKPATEGFVPNDSGNGSSSEEEVDDDGMSSTEEVSENEYTDDDGFHPGSASFSTSDNASPGKDNENVTIIIGRGGQQTEFSLPASKIEQHSAVLFRMIRERDGHQIIDNVSLSNVLPMDFAVLQEYMLDGDSTPIFVENTSTDLSKATVKPGWFSPIGSFRSEPFRLPERSYDGTNNDALAPEVQIVCLGRLLVLGLKLRMKGFVENVIEWLQHGFPSGYPYLAFLRLAKKVLSELEEIDFEPHSVSIVVKVREWIAEVLGSKQTELALDQNEIGDTYWDIIECNPLVAEKLDGGRAKIWVRD